ncbi:MAG: hypothetical protein ACYDAC_12370 [Candidatus Dormibacteria bacterium]
MKQAILANPEGNGNLDDVTVTVSGTQVVVVDKLGSNAVLDEQGLITAEAENTLSVVKAINSGFKGVTLIHVQLDSDFTDSNGNTIKEPAAWIEMTNATFNPINADGLQLSTFSQPADLYAKADAYYIHPAVWKNISSDHRGSLSESSGGISVLATPAP